MNYTSLSKEELKVLEKEFFFDMRGYKKNDSRSKNVQLVKKGSERYELGKSYHALVPLRRGLKLIIKHNMAVSTLLTDESVSKKIEKFLIDNGVISLIIEQ